MAAREDHQTRRPVAERGWITVLTRPNGLTRPFTRPDAAFLTLSVFLTLMLVLQVWLQSAGRNDDGEQFLFTQSWAIGYDIKNPPLITWLILGVMEITGPTFFAIRLVISGILFLTCLFLFLATDKVVRDRRLAVLAGLAPMTVLHFAWYPYINLTHTLMLACMSAATIWAALALIAQPAIGRFVVFGLVAGLGLLSKYNYGLYLAATVAALLVLPSVRRRVLTPWLGLSVVIAAAIALPHYLWLLEHMAQAKAVLEEKWHVAADQAGMLATAMTGSGALLEAVLSFLMPMLGLVVLFFWYAFVPGWARADRADELGPRQAFAWTVHGIVLLALLGLLLALQATYIRNHHVFFLITIPVALFALIDRCGARAWSLNLFSAAVALCMVIVLGTFFWWIDYNQRTCSKCTLLMPYDRYASALTDNGFRPGTVLVLGTGDFFLGEQMRMHMPDARYLRPGNPLKKFYQPASNPWEGNCAIVWSEDRRPDLGERVRRGQVPEYPALPAETLFGTVTARLKGIDRLGPTMGYAIVPGGLGDCR